MKAAVCRGAQRLSIEEVPTPRPGPGQVLVKVKYCAICGTDVHLFQHDMVKPGTILGHEYCGVIAATGEGVNQWRVGDRVVGGGGMPPTGVPSHAMTMPRFTYRTAWLAAPSHGAYAEYVLQDAWALLPTPVGVPDEAAALAEPCAIAVHAIRRSSLRLGDKVVVLGAGPIGLLCLQMAKIAGASAVYVVEPSSARARAAEKLGADKVIDPMGADIVSEIVALTGGVGPDVAFECAGAASTLQHGLEMVRRGGQVVLVSLAWKSVPVLTVEWVGREVELKACASKTPQEWQIALDLMKSGKLQIGPMITKDSYVSLDDIQEVFESLLTPTDRIKLLVVP